MATWDQLTVTWEEVKALSPADFVSAGTGAIDSDALGMVEARRLLRVAITAALGAHVSGYPGGIVAFFDRLAEVADPSYSTPDDFLRDELAAALTCYYRAVAYRGYTMGEGDLWSAKASDALKDAKNSVAALAQVIPRAILGQGAPGRYPGAFGAVGVYDRNQ